MKMKDKEHEKDNTLSATLWLLESPSHNVSPWLSQASIALSSDLLLIELLHSKTMGPAALTGLTFEARADDTTNKITTSIPTSVLLGCQYYFIRAPQITPYGTTRHIFSSNVPASPGFFFTGKRSTTLLPRGKGKHSIITKSDHLGAWSVGPPFWGGSWHSLILCPRGTVAWGFSGAGGASAQVILLRF
jgi:hypothetical protein